MIRVWLDMSYGICWYPVKYGKTHNFDWVLKCFVHRTICPIITLAKTKTVTNQKILVFLSVKKEKKNPQALPCSCVASCAEHTEFFPTWLSEPFQWCHTWILHAEHESELPPVLKVGEHWLWSQGVSCLQWLTFCCLVVKSCQLFSTHGLQPTRLLCPWDFSSRNTEMGISFARGSSWPRDWTPDSCIGR